MHAPVTAPEANPVGKEAPIAPRKDIEPEYRIFATVLIAFVIHLLLFNSFFRMATKQVWCKLTPKDS